VKIDLIVRGICCLRPGIPGISENIRVRSIVGRFLEHTRIFHFHADGAATTYCGSADWMPRNLRYRVEVCFPVESQELKDRVIAEGLTPYLTDNTEAWELQSDGTYVQLRPGKDRPFCAQERLISMLAEGPGPVAIRGQR
jgi:polyphosphate kinase